MAVNPVAAASIPDSIKAKAAFLGQLVNFAYTMYDNDPSNPTPSPAVPLPGNYQFVAWVQMRDFFIWEGAYTFYGLLARKPSTANEYVLAIRGTSSWTEWWDDFRSMGQTTLPNFGNGTALVGTGFWTIYNTLRLIYHPQLAAAPGVMAAPPESLEAAGTFADQVAAAVRRHVAETTPPGAVRPEALAATASITVTGHSLGSALATLYVAENYTKQLLQIPLLCTLASPRVGDPNFATQFDNLGIASWRIDNYPDVVPDTPFDIPPFYYWQHIQTEYQFDSYSWTQISLECYHSIYTYLHGLDSALPPLSNSWWQNCYYSDASRSAALRARKRRAAAAALPAPAEKEIAVAAPAGTTINITIKTG
jgi:hypothetical protein